MRNKYGAKKTTVNGIVFDSGAEATYYKELLKRKETGAIRDFELQPKFLLQPGFKKNGQTIRAITYTADFKVIGNDGAISYIDVKGFETEVFKIKRKLFEEKYPDLSLQIVKVKTSERAARVKTDEEKARGKERAFRKKRSKERRRDRSRESEG